jgi:hypothetical protein
MSFGVFRAMHFARAYLNTAQEAFDNLISSEGNKNARGMLLLVERSFYPNTCPRTAATLLDFFEHRSCRLWTLEPRPVRAVHTKTMQFMHRFG